MPADPLPHPSSQLHHPVGTPATGPLHGPNSTPPKALARLSKGSPTTPPGAVAPGNGVMATVKDTIPIAKTPRKQRSSRFHVTGKPEITRLPGFMGPLPSLGLFFALTLADRGAIRRAARPAHPEAAASLRHLRL
jgi:serine/threonine-protein phosphatase 2A regulatory subunit B'